MTRNALILAIVVAAALGAAVAYLWLPRRIVVSDAFDPNLTV